MSALGQSGHSVMVDACPFYPQKRTSEPPRIIFDLPTSAAWDIYRSGAPHHGCRLFASGGKIKNRFNVGVVISMRALHNAISSVHRSRGLRSLIAEMKASYSHLSSNKRFVPSLPYTRTITRRYSAQVRTESVRSAVRTLSRPNGLSICPTAVFETCGLAKAADTSSEDTVYLRASGKR